MKRKTIIGLVALLALLVFATTANADQLYIEKNGNKLTHSERVRIKPGVVVSENVAGKEIFRLKAPGKSSPIVKITCQDTRTDNLTNTETEAHDEATEVVFFGCTEGATVTALTNWHGELQGAGEPFAEPISDMAIEVTTPERLWGTFAGSTITATFGDNDPIPRDDIDPHFKTTATGSGELFNPESMTLAECQAVRFRCASLQLVTNDFYGTKGVNRADGERNGEPEENSGGEEGGE